MSGKKLTILFSGMIAADPFQGGATWAVMQYILGLHRLGHDVYFVEPVPAQSVRPAGSPLEASDNARYFHWVNREFSLRGRAALLAAGTRQTVGVPYDDVRQWAARADMLINVSGMLADPALIEPIPRRVYLDLDPAFVQLWHATQGVDMRLDAHTHFVTVGRNIGSPPCTVPTCGRDWVTTAPPVVLEHWPVTGLMKRDALTTIANWRGYGSIEHGGVHYGQKAHSLRRFIDLPRRTRERFELALSIDPGDAADIEALRQNGWKLVDPREVAASPLWYAVFVRGSKAEFGVAKSGYVASRCGWFSDRSACYLASGRPVIAQETGWTDGLPTGEGLFSFETAEDVLCAIDALNSDYEKHRRAARAIAETYFNSDVVLPRLLEAVGAA
jgi:hypothetical protein